MSRVLEPSMVGSMDCFGGKVTDWNQGARGESVSLQLVGDDPWNG